MFAEADSLQERKDALTKKPLDFDLEEETRKKETTKWLEHHFGSDSRSSRDSIGDEIDEAPTTSYFNVTIKSQPEVPTSRSRDQPPKVISPPRARAPPAPSPEVIPPPSRTKGYFQGVSEWTQRRADEARLREEMSPKLADSPSPDRGRPLRSPALQRDDSAYVSSSTVNAPYRRPSPERASPFQSLERRNSPDRAYSPYGPRYRQGAQPQRYKTPEEEIHYERGPAPPERKRAAERKQRTSDDSNRYDSGYRSHSRNEASYREEAVQEPPPDYSPPRGARLPTRSRSRSPSPSPSPQPPRSSRKPPQRTRFAAEEPKTPERRSVGAAIGQSIRKLVGKIRSASQERKGRKGARASRSPSPRRDLSSTYRQYGSVDSDPPRPERNGERDSTSRAMDRRGRAEPLQRYYLGEDPFGGSIYGRENKYDGARPQRVPNRKTYINGHNGSSDVEDHR